MEVGSVYSILLCINYFALYLYCNMEFFDNGATCYSSLTSERTFSIFLRTHAPHIIHTTFTLVRKQQISKRRVCVLWCMCF